MIFNIFSCIYSTSLLLDTIGKLYGQEQAFVAGVPMGLKFFFYVLDQLYQSSIFCICDT